MELRKVRIGVTTTQQHFNDPTSMMNGSDLGFIVPYFIFTNFGRNEEMNRNFRDISLLIVFFVQIDFSI